MLTVVDKYKNGKATIYVCNDDNGNKIEIDKDRIKQVIENKNVRNASIQIYKGLVIIRVHNVKSSTATQQTKSNNTSKSTSRKTSKNKKLAIDVFKDIMSEFNIQNTDEALAFAFDRYDFDLEIDTLSTQDYYTLRFEMASDIKRMADRENIIRLQKYRLEYRLEYMNNK